MKILKNILIAISLLTMTACATQDVRLVDADKIDVLVYGDPEHVANKEQLEQLALYKGASFASEQGYQYLVVTKKGFAGTDDSLGDNSFVSSMTLFKHKPNNERAISTSDFVAQYNGPKELTTSGSRFARGMGKGFIYAIIGAAGGAGAIATMQ